MKVLIVNDDYDYWRSSVVRIALEEAKELLKRGHEVLFISTTQSAAQVGEQLIEGIKAHIYYDKYHLRFRGYRGLYNGRLLFKLRKIFFDFSPDVVHFHNIHSHMSYAALKLAKKMGAKVFLTAHDAMIFCYQKYDCFPHKEEMSVDDCISYRVSQFKCLKCQRLRFVPFRNYFIKHYLNHYADKVICVSGEVMRALETNGIKNIVTIHNGIKKDWIGKDEQNENALRQKWDIQTDKVILCGGRFSPLKGIEVLLKTLASLKKQDYMLIIMGEGRSKYARKLKDLSAQLGIASRVRFTGWLMDEELKAAYTMSFICVIPSLCFESFSMFALESMMAKKPVVSTIFGGPAELIEEGRSGFLVNPFRKDILREKISYLLDNDEMARQMGERGYEIAMNKFLFKYHIDKLLALYEAGQFLNGR